MLDAKTGEVLALVNLPDFNPNNRAKFNVEELRNRSLTDPFEPGSTFKPFAVAAGLEAGIVQPTTVMLTGREWQVGANTVTDTHPLAQMSVAQLFKNHRTSALAKSLCNYPLKRCGICIVN
ncbi:MAG: hypothetical protein HC782_01090 [Gammaproteobacteria bacterium]|nr:hypothetical protein [Gammaproteobacteria bacterium]